MSWFGFSLISIFALAVAELTQQHLLNKKNAISERVSLSLTFLTQAFFTFPIIMLTSLRREFFSVFTSGMFPIIAFSTLVGSIAMIFYLRSFKVKNISISTILISLSVVVSTTLGIVFFNESFYPIKILGLALVLIAIVSVNIQNLMLEKNHAFALIAGVLFGVMYTIDKFVVAEINPVIYIFWSFNMVSLFGFLQKPSDFINTIKKSTIDTYKPVLISGIGYLIYNLATFISYTAGGEVGRVDAINNSQVFLIILFEYFILKQKTGWVRKLTTSAIAFTGVYILGVY